MFVMKLFELPVKQNINELTFIFVLLHHTVHSSFQLSNPLFQPQSSVPSANKMN